MLTRSTPLRRSASLGRSRKRAAKLHERNFGERAAAVRAMPCLVPGCPRPSQAAHARARGMGGCGGDRRELVPLCAEHHRESGERRTSDRADFERLHGLDLEAEARRLAERFDEDGLP
jgi:hypothetical protein